MELAGYTHANTFAICILDLDDIETRFYNATEACLEGEQAHGVNYLNGKNYQFVSR